MNNEGAWYKISVAQESCEIFLAGLQVCYQIKV